MIYVCVRCGGGAEVELTYNLLGLDKMKNKFNMSKKHVEQIRFFVFLYEINAEEA